MSRRPPRSPSRRGRGALAIALMAALLLPLDARADGLADEAELHFQIGAERYQTGDYRGALEHFLLSNRLVPNRNVVFNIARTFEQMRRFADAHRYYVDARNGETDAKVLKNLEAAIARIAPDVAVLDVVTSPPGTTLYIDRRDLGSRGRAPRPLALPPGRYQVIAELDGYEPQTSEVVEAKLGSETRVSLTLTRILGTVRVGVEGAPGAAVRVGGPRADPACNAPCDLKLPPGQHQLFFTREGFQAAPRLVTVIARQTTETVAALSPLTGTVIVSADERDALITINGRSMGFTPAVIRDVPAGPAKVRVSLRGHVPVEREIVVAPNQQAQLQNLELRPLREVTAVSRYAEQVDDAPSSVSIIDGQELRAFGYPTIAESLRGVRGVYLSNDRAYTSAGVRGVGEPGDYGNRLLVLSDGQMLNDNLLSSSYIGSDGRADLQDIDRIEIVRGPGSLLYGTGAFAGVVNLVTRARDEPSQVHLGIGTYDNAVARARAGFHHNFAPNLGVWASGWAARSSGFSSDVTLKDPAGGPAVQAATGVEAFTSGGTAGRAWWGPLTAQWFYHRRSQSVPVGAYATRFDDGRTGFIDTRMMAEVRYEPKLASMVQLMTRAHANRYLFHGRFSFDTEDNVEDFYGTWFGGEARLVVTPSSRVRITGGGEGQVGTEATLFGQTEAAGVITPYLDTNRPYNFGAGYGLVEVSPISWFRFSGGARVDVYSTFGPIFVPRAALIFYMGRGSESAVPSNLGRDNGPIPGGVLKLMGGRAFRAPSIYEQDYNDSGITEVPAVDPARGLTLGAESVYSGEIEYSQRFREDWVAVVAGYVSHLEGLISTIPDTPGSDLLRYANSDFPAMVIGGELELRREWRQGWMLGAMYGYQRAFYRDSPLDNPRLVNAPEHLASIRGVAPVVAELVSAGLRLTLEAPRRIDLGSDDVTGTAVVADATISGSVRRFGLRYVVGVYNLADWRHELPVDDGFLSRTMPQNGRTFLLDLVGTYP